MTHSDSGRYAAKHKTGAIPDERIGRAVGEKAVNGKLACVAAEGIGSTLGVSLAEIGMTLDLLEMRIDRCQLGLFGYPEGKALQTATEVAPDLESDLRGSLADGRLPCKTAWEIASRRKIARMAVASACEMLKIRIKPCQLGAF